MDREGWPHVETSVTEERGVQVQILPNLEAISHQAVRFFIDISKSSFAERDQFVVALSGGTTPRKFYRLLGSPPYREKVDWDRVHLFWVDERCVPKEDEASNFKLVFDTVLSAVPIPEKNIHPMRTERGAEQGAREYEEELRKFFGGSISPMFDLILLGVGEDGHTASLFPGSESLRERSRLVVPVYLGEPGKDRITLTLPVLNQARHILFLVAGHSKAEMVRTILEKEAHRTHFPAGLVHPANGQVTWFIDEEAASLLAPSARKG
jgi:6-phosphogluconolactonase